MSNLNSVKQVSSTKNGRKINAKRRKRNRHLHHRTSGNTANNKKNLKFNTNSHNHNHNHNHNHKPEHARERDNYCILQNKPKRTISRARVDKQCKVFYLTLNNNGDQVLQSDLRFHHHFDAFCQKSPTLYLWMQSILKWNVNQKRIAGNAKFKTSSRVHSLDIYLRSTATAVTVHVLFAIIAELWAHNIVGLLQTTTKEAIYNLKAEFYSPYVLEQVPGVYSTQKDLRQLICYLLQIPSGFVIEIVVMQPPPTDNDKDKARARTKKASKSRQRAATKTVYVWLYNYQRTQQTATMPATATSATATKAETIDGGHNDSNEHSSRQRFRRLPTLAVTADDNHNRNRNRNHKHSDSDRDSDNDSPHCSSDSITMVVANSSIIMKAIKPSNLSAINMQMDVHSSSMSKNCENYSDLAHDHSTHNEEPHQRNKKTKNKNTSTNTGIPMTVIASAVPVVINGNELKTGDVLCSDSEMESELANNANTTVNANTILGESDSALNAKEKKQQKNIDCIESDHPKSNKICDFPGMSDDDDDNESESECNNDIGTVVTNTTRKRKILSIERNWNSTDSGTSEEEESPPFAQPKKRMKMSNN